VQRADVERLLENIGAKGHTDPLADLQEALQTAREALRRGEATEAVKKLQDLRQRVQERITKLTG
jgi:hypothetical protein